MKYKTYEDVLKAEKPWEAFNEYLKDLGMTDLEWLLQTEEGRKLSEEATRVRMTTPYPERYFPGPSKFAQKKAEEEPTEK